MKKYLMIVLTMFIAFSLTNVYADEYVVVSTPEEFTTAKAAGGNIRLANNITMPSNTQLTKAITLDLNGHTLNMGGNVFLVANNVTVQDTASNGAITGTGSFVIQVGTSSVQGSLLLQSGAVRGSTYGIRVVNGSMQMDGGYVYAPAFAIYNQGTLTINEGKVVADEIVTIQNYLNATLTMNGGEIVMNGIDVAINMYGSCTATINGGSVIAETGEGDDGGTCITFYKDTNLTINGGYFSSYLTTLMGNGSESGPNEGRNAQVTIKDGNFNSMEKACLYIPQINGKTNISGGEFNSQYTAIEIRAGDLNITGGTFRGSTTDYEVKANYNGITTKGAGVSIAQHTTKQPINVYITGGSFFGAVPISYTNPQNNPEEAAKKVKVYISDNGNLHFNEDQKSEETVTVLDNTVIIDSPEVINVMKNISIEGNTVIIHDIPEQKGYDAYVEVYDLDNNLLYRTTNKEIPTNGNDIKIKVKYELKENPITLPNIFPIVTILLLTITTIVITIKERKVRKSYEL